MTRRQTATVAFIVLCVVLVAAAVSLNVGWILVNGRRVLPLVLGVLAFALIIAGIVVFTVFLVRELRRNEQHDAFINSVTHELKTPIASIRLYLETLQAREVGDQQRKEFYKVMLADAERLQHTVEQVLKAGVAGQRPRLAQRAPVDMAALTRECVETARRRHHLPDEAITLNIPDSQQRLFVSGDVDELRTALSNLLDNAVKYLASGRAGPRRGGRARATKPVGAGARPRRRHPEVAAETDLHALLPLPDAGLQGEGHGPRAVHRAFGRQAARRSCLRAQ